MSIRTRLLTGILLATASLTAVACGGPSAPSTPAGSSAGTATIGVERVGNVSALVSVQYATSNGTAIAGKQYAPASGTLTFLPGQSYSEQTFAVTILPNTSQSASTTTVSSTASSHLST